MKSKSHTLSTWLMSVTAMAIMPAMAVAAIDPSNQPFGYVGDIELSSADISTEPKAYRGWFENGLWQGDLVQYSLATSGAISTTIDLTTSSPSQDGTNPATNNWSANLKFAEAVTADASYWSNRKIITRNSDSGNQVAFLWANLSQDQRQLLDAGLDKTNAGLTSDILNFIRGDSSNEYPAAGAIFRDRLSLLGDIIHSNPEYVKEPNRYAISETYAAFKEDHKIRAARVYVGANDGMLHAFNADTGAEEWAYIPSMLMANLDKLGYKPFAHHYYVDGHITIQDAYNKANDSWKTVLVGSLGAGGKGVYALDVTDPSIADASSTSGSDIKLLWEKAAINNMGHVFGDIVIANLGDGDSWAVFGNGVASNNGRAVLFMVRIRDGLVKMHTVNTTDSDNGLSAPALVDANFDGKVDFAYAGDLKGNLHRFDLSDSTIADKNSAQYTVYSGPSSPNTQPITTAPEVSYHPTSGYIVTFGTGKLYEIADVIDTTAQAIVGAWDNGSAPASPKALDQTLTASLQYTSGSINEFLRNISPARAINNSYTHWKVTLAPCERVLTDVHIRGGRVKAIITHPDTNSNWLFEVDYKDGGNYSSSVFNFNGDGSLNSNDRIDGNGDLDRLDAEDIPVARRRSDGHMSGLTIARLSKGRDTSYTNFLYPPNIPEPTDPEEPEGETGDVVGGLVGGHFDLDYDVTLGGTVTKHKHLYDDIYGTTVVDFFNLEGSIKSVDTIAQKTDNVFNMDSEFIVVITNADFSPGATFTLNKKTYTVYEYQKMIHQKLLTWDGTTSLMDGAHSLVLTLDEIQNNGGEMITAFNSRAIFDGGMHPIKASCAIKSFKPGTDFTYDELFEDENENDLWKKEGKCKANYTAMVTNDRFRNGVLVTQLIDKNWLQTQIANNKAAGGTNTAIDYFVQQRPYDMVRSIRGVKMWDDTDTNNVIDANETVYGGLYAKLPAPNNICSSSTNERKALFYESTVYWHYGKDKSGGDWADSVHNIIETCYGNPTWASTVEEHRVLINTIVTNDAIADLGFDNYQELLDEIKRLENNIGCTRENAGSTTGCDEYITLKNTQGDFSGENYDDDLAVDDDDEEDEETIEDGVPTGDKDVGKPEGGDETSGNNAQLGRRSWTEITPQ